MAATKPITTSDADEKDKKPADTVEKPVPSQAKADDVREEAAATSAEPARKPAGKAGKAAEPSHEAPYPTQADLDAMKAGQSGNREAAATTASGASYQTR